MGDDMIRTFCAICRWPILVPAAGLEEARKEGAVWICGHEERHLSPEFRL